MYYDYPFRRTYETAISTKYGSCFLRYYENMMWEAMLMVDNFADMKYIIQWYTKFIDEHAVYGDIKDDVKARIRSELINNPNELVMKTRENLNPHWESIYSGISTPSGSRKSIFGVDMLTICKEFNIKWPNDLLENYTLAQYEWMTDAIVFAAYEADKKTRGINNKALDLHRRKTNTVLSKEDQELLAIIKKQSWKKYKVITSSTDKPLRVKK